MHQRRRPMHLREVDAVEAQADDRRQVVLQQPAVEIVGPHIDETTALRERLDRPGHGGPRPGLLLGGHGVLEVEGDDVGRDGLRLGNEPRVGSRHRQDGTDHPTFTTMVFVWVYSEAASTPFSRPKPDFLTPPNGSPIPPAAPYEFR